MARQATPEEQLLCKKRTKQLYDALAAEIRKFVESWPPNANPGLLIQTLLHAVSRLSGDVQKASHVLQMPLPLMLLTAQQGIELSEDQPNFRLFALLKELDEAAEQKYKEEHPEEDTVEEQVAALPEPPTATEESSTGAGSGKIHVEELPDCGRPHCTLHGNSEQALQRRKGLHYGQA